MDAHRLQHLLRRHDDRPGHTPGRGVRRPARRAGKGNIVFDNVGNVAVLDINGTDVTINGLSQPAASTTNLVVNNGPGMHTLSVGGGNASSTFNGVLADTTGGGGTLALRQNRQRHVEPGPRQQLFRRHDDRSGGG